MEASTPTADALQPHATTVVAWDVPSAIVAGERFRLKVGVKCSSECQLTGATVGIYDHEGTPIATGTLGGRWSGTSGLYVAEVELQAPVEHGLHTWSARGPGSDGAASHAEGSGTFGVRVVGQAECLVTVEAIDKDNGKPLPGARVVMHPYKAVADERGVARVRVPKGAYRLFVTETRYVTFGLPVEVTADMTARAELELEPETERN